MQPQKNLWQSALIEAVTDPKELLELLELNEHFLPGAMEAHKLFPLKVPRGFIDRMKKGDRYDPLLLQVLPVDLEKMDVSGYTKDPLQEAKSNPIPGLLHKYQSRVLLTLTGACAVNCRFCFRRHFPYADNNPGSHGWQKVIDYIAEDQSIHEVILSGGDPLVMNDHLLSEFAHKIALIPHLKRLRIHTRTPIVLPERVCDALTEWIGTLRLKTAIVLHCNHPHEINDTVRDALTKLADSGAILLNQTVLLKNINDSVDVLSELSEKLFDCGVLPYYLHLLDKVQGISHFDKSIEDAKKIHLALTQRLSGYLVPKLVMEQPGEASKLAVYSSEFYTD